MGHGLTFRRAVAADFAVVLELANQLAAQIEARAPQLTPAHFQTAYIGPDAPMHLLLAIKDGRVAGLISWTLTHELYSGEARVYISDLSIDRAARGQGIGSALMDEVKAWAHTHGAAKLGWEVWHRNFAARAFYTRLGASVDEEAIPFVLAIGKEAP